MADISTDNKVMWEDDWIPKDCIILSTTRVRKHIEEVASHISRSAWSQLKRRLSYVGTLKKPISNKNYMYYIDSGYYESYIFGKNSDDRLVFDFYVEDGVTVIVIFGLTDHGGVKNRVGKVEGMESESNNDFLSEDDMSFFSMFW